MNFDHWLTAQNLTSAKFARLSGIGDRQAVHKYRHGERFPTVENLRRIRDATKGAVTADDFVDQHTGKSPSQPGAPKQRAKRPTPASSPPPHQAEKAA